MTTLNRSTVSIRDLYPTKAQFRPGEPVRLVAELTNDGGAARIASLRITMMELDETVRTQEASGIAVPARGEAVVTVDVGAYDAAFAGFGVTAELFVAGEAKASAGTAFDVAADWRFAPRYGFLSDFGTEEAGDAEDVAWMTKLHLNVVQFYDWMYRHDDLVSEEETYTDLMGRAVSRSVVEEKIRECQTRGMKAIAYGAVYAASKPFAERHPDWRLYTSAGEPYDFIGIFNIMNIAPDSPWSRHIVAEYRKAVERLGFDGIHMDTYGFPKTGWSRTLDDGASRAAHGKAGADGWRLERLAEQFAPLIEAARAELSQAKDDIGLIFNNVGNWPVDTVATASQDALYIEVWAPYERYAHLSGIIRSAKREGGGKPVILAAYLKPFRVPGPLGVEGAEHGFRLAQAVIASHGAFHLLHGEAGGVLTQGYYVDHSRLRPVFRRTVRDYADFIVRYGVVLFDPALRDVSMTHAYGDNEEYGFRGFPHSACGEPGKVWTVLRESGTVKLMSFVNLTAAEDDFWNEGKPKPEPVAGRVCAVAFDGEIESLFVATPDARGGAPAKLDYRVETTTRGKTALFELPELHCWDIVVMRVRV